MQARMSLYLRLAFLTFLLSSASLGVFSSTGNAETAVQSAATPVAVDATPVALGTPESVDTQAAWLQLGPDGILIARAISTASCPEIKIDTVAFEMNVRAEPTIDHPVTVCETVIPNSPESVQIGDENLPIPVADPQRVLVIGDGGCRIKSDTEFQACNDPKAWPLATVAQQATAWEPDLILHVGDYLYREVACPEGEEGCAGSPHGDTWSTWQADFFNPATPLLTAAPWIFSRGNHESCGRSGIGWFRYLDPRPMPASCLDFTAPYAVAISDQQAVVLDSASAEDTEPDPKTTEAFKKQFAGVEKLTADAPTWLVTHKPFWSISDDDQGNPIEWTTATYTSAGYLQPPGNIDMVIAGHVHLAQVMSFTQTSDRPVQIISGNGGTLLESFETGVFSADDVDDPALVAAWRYQEFGFMGLEKTDAGWVLTAHMVDGSTPISCLIVEKDLACIA